MSGPFSCITEREQNYGIKYNFFFKKTHTDFKPDDLYEAVIDLDADLFGEASGRGGNDTLEKLLFFLPTPEEEARLAEYESRGGEMAHLTEYTRLIRIMLSIPQARERFSALKLLEEPNHKPTPQHS